MFSGFGGGEGRVVMRVWGEKEAGKGILGYRDPEQGDGLKMCGGYADKTMVNRISTYRPSRRYCRASRPAR